jgi:hypothetical protein
MHHQQFTPTGETMHPPLSVVGNLPVQLVLPGMPIPRSLSTINPSSSRLGQNGWPKYPGWYLWFPVRRRASRACKRLRFARTHDDVGTVRSLNPPRILTPTMLKPAHHPIALQQHRPPPLCIRGQPTTVPFPRLEVALQARARAFGYSKTKSVWALVRVQRNAHMAPCPPRTLTPMLLLATTSIAQ